MMTEAQKNVLRPLAEVAFDEPMARHTTFRVGGPAEAFAVPTRKELPKLLAFAKKEQIPLTILGNGSNVLVSDDGLSGLVISIGEPMAEIAVSGEEVRMGAGAMIVAAARAAGEAGLSGLEFAGGIPGSVGGAVVMNGGAYGGEMADVLTSVTVLDGNGEEKIYSADELELSYRHSIFMEETHRDEIILSATMKLAKGNADEIQAKMADFNARRREKQPLEFPSAGSTFKRPAGNFAGKLIQEAGLAGYTVGGAQVSEKHCGFVINKGNATAKDILAVIRYVQSEVERTSGIRLEEEVRLLGFGDKITNRTD